MQTLYLKLHNYTEICNASRVHALTEEHTDSLGYMLIVERWFSVVWIGGKQTGCSSQHSFGYHEIKFHIDFLLRQSNYFSS